MSISEQEALKETYYNEANRYMDNANECLKKAKKEDNYYHDQKNVRMACETTYSGLLVALDCFLLLKITHYKNRFGTIFELYIIKMYDVRYS